MTILSPLMAVALTVVAGFIIFTLYGIDPLGALYVYFIEKLTAWWSIQDLIVKMTPLIMIAVGLALCYLSNVWNIGAEGQLSAGAIANVRRIKNPILLAKTIMQESEHVFLSGEGAENFGHQHNIEFETEEYFYDEYRYQHAHQQPNEHPNQHAHEHADQHIY